MAEYIERSYIRKMAMFEMAYTMETETDAAVVLRMIDDAPAADVAPVVHAEWLEDPFESIWPGDFDTDGNFIVHTYMAWKCSRCGRRIPDKQYQQYQNGEPYCHCGAKMGGGDSHETD